MNEESKRYLDMNNNVHKVARVLVEDKNILVRGDFDVDDLENPRTESVREIVRHLQRRGAKFIRVIGHTETMFKVVDELRREFPGVEFDDGLRNNPGEKANDSAFAKSLCDGFDVYVNESFAVSHRKHASIVGVPEIMKSKGLVVCMGMRFEKEIEMLDSVWRKEGKRILVIGGTKVEDKQRFAEDMNDKFVHVLRGGLLPGVKLRKDGLDLADETIDEYVEKISKAEVILAAGVMGKYEDKNAQEGTRRVLEAIVESKAYKVAGGGDIERAIDMFGLTEKFDWISVGGGAMLVYLETGTLPGLDKLRV